MSAARDRRRTHRPVLDELASAGLGGGETVVLVGSYARGVTNQQSDVGVLVLHDGGHRIRLKRPGDIHLQQDSRSRFLKRLREGYDYPAWALRFGLPLRDPDGWWSEQVASEAAAPHRPDWRAKLKYARKRTRMASELLAVDDTDAASEELLFATSHLVRATLLKAGEFPLSRPELPSQLKTLDSHLAQLLKRLMIGNVDATGIRAGESLLRRRIEQISEAS